jgi:hypothetical protein
MIHIYTNGGDWSRDGIEYTVKTVHFNDLEDHLDDGWFRSFDEMKGNLPESGSDYEAEIRAKIKSLGGKPAGRSSIETLEKQLAELESGDDNEA